MMTEPYNLSNSRDRYISVNSRSELFQKVGFWYREFPSDPEFVRFESLLIVQSIPDYIPDQDILKQQISELLLNAVIHGNCCDPQKVVRVWYDCSDTTFSMIVQDEGKGFHDVELWNSWCRKRREYIETRQLYLHPQYVVYDRYILDHSYSTHIKTDGTALFAAVEYWNCGVVFSESGNTIAVRKKFPLVREDEVC